MTTAALSYSKTNLPSVNWKIVFFASFSVCFCLLAFYVYLINDLTRGAYLMSNYEKEVLALRRESGRLEVISAEKGLLEQITEKAREMDFLKTTSVRYIQILDASLASASRENMK